jgi:hypothetical protein
MAATPVGGEPDGEWYKWDGTDFTEPGMWGVATPIWDTDKYAGAYPRISYNTYLNSYVMLFSHWENMDKNGAGIYLSTSPNLKDWDEPRLILSNKDLPSGSVERSLWYGTLIGSSSNFSDKNAKLYFAHMQDVRIFYQADVTFTGTIAPNYTVTVSSDGMGATDDGKYQEGAVVTINAGTPPSGKYFENWTANPDIEFDDENMPSTWFTMPAHDVTVTANFVDNIVPTQSTDGSGSGCDILGLGAVIMLLTAGAALVKGVKRQP